MKNVNGCNDIIERRMNRMPATLSFEESRKEAIENGDIHKMISHRNRNSYDTAQQGKANDLYPRHMKLRIFMCFGYRKRRMPQPNAPFQQKYFYESLFPQQGFQQLW
jgi:hypothetical protein